MAKRPPELVALDHDNHSAEYVGRTEEDRQFFLTRPFVPAVGDEPGREYVALYLFEPAGRLTEARIEDMGTRGGMDEGRAEAVRDEMLASLGNVSFGRIQSRPVPGGAVRGRVRVHPPAARGAGRGLVRDRRAGGLHVLLAAVDERGLRHVRPSEPRVHRLALQGQDAEDALVDPPQRLPPHEPLQPLDPQGELAQGQRPLPPQAPGPEPGEVRLGRVVRAVDDPQVLPPPALHGRLGQPPAPLVDERQRLDHHPLAAPSR